MNSRKQTMVKPFLLRWTIWEHLFSVILKAGRERRFIKFPCHIVKNLNVYRMRSRMIQFFCCMIFVSTIKEQDSLLKKNAIFFSFEDFKNNKPAIDTLKLHLQENRACSHT